MTDAATAVDAAPARARRLDVQGLRAVASLLVASYHIWIGTISGGVDVFFVLGGFLLATSVVGEIERRGRLDAWGATWRMLARQLPLVGIVVGVSAAVAIAVRPLGFLRETALDALAAATFWQNWRLAASSTDYVDAGLDKSVVQHLWAMGVQLQASIAVLVVAAIVAVVLRRRGDARVRRGLAIALGALVVASAAYALVAVAIDPVTAYYDTGARIWELGLGALLGVVAIRVVLGRAAREVLAAVGLVLVLGAGLLPSEWSYPGPVALVPVAGALLLLAAGASGSSVVGRVLASRPLVWLGGLSFGMYLWHWPIVWLMAQLDPRPIGPYRGLAVLVAAIALSWASTTLLRHARAWWGRERRMPWTAATVPLVAVAATVLLVLPAPSASVRLGDAQLSVASSTEVLQARVQQALAEPGPIADGLEVWDAGRAAGWMQGCLEVDAANRAECEFVPEGYDAAQLDTVWVAGDSHSLGYASSVREAVGEWASVQMMAYAECAWVDRSLLDEWLDEDRAASCADHTDWVIDRAIAEQPQLVVLSYGAWRDADELDDDDVDRFVASASARVEPLVAAQIPVLWLDAPPPTSEWDDCMASQRRGSNDACVVAMSQSAVDVRHALAAGLASVGVTVEDTLPWFCDVDGLRCPIVVDGVPVYADHAHIGEAQAIVITHLVHAGIQRAITTS